MFSGCTVPLDSKKTKLWSSDQQTSPSADANTVVVLVSYSRVEVRLYSYFQWCGCFSGPWVSLVTTYIFSTRVTKITWKIGVSWSHDLPFCFRLILTQWIVAILSKVCKPDNFDSRNSLSLSFTNIWDLRSNFVDSESFLGSFLENSPDILALLDKPGWPKWFWQFLCEGLSSFNSKGFYYLYALSCSLCEERTSFFTGLISTKLCRFLLMFSTSFTSLCLTSFFSIDHLFCYTQFLILFHLT